MYDFGEPSYALTPKTRSKIGLLYEGHLCYDFLTIEQIEAFHKPFYKNWKSDIFFGLVDLLGLEKTHKIRNMSYGQRAQVVLGLIFAQDPQLLILDDYSLGLDAGYRRLFLDLLKDFIKDDEKTVIVTSHVVNDLEKIIDEVFILERGGNHLHTKLDDFLQTFNYYEFKRTDTLDAKAFQDKIKKCLFKGFSFDSSSCKIFSKLSTQEIKAQLQAFGVPCLELKTLPMSLEDAFVGYTGLM